MGDVSGHPLDARATQVGEPPPGDLGHEISLPTAGERARIEPANAAAAATLGCQISLFSDHSRPTHTSLPSFLDPLNSYLWSFFFFFFFQIPHCLKDTTKKSLADGWIEFSGNHNNFWTKVRVLLCSWSLGLSVDIKFVNFGRRLVSFSFLGHLG